MSSLFNGTDAFSEVNKGLSRLSSTLLNANSTAQQLLCTVPAGGRLIPVKFLFRDNTFAYTGAASSAFTATLGNYRTIVVQQNSSSLSGSTSTLTNLIPAGATVTNLNTLVTTAVTGSSVTGFTIGDGTTANKFGTVTNTAVGTSSTYTGGTTNYSSATSIVLTATGGSFTGGVVQVTMTYTLLVAIPLFYASNAAGTDSLVVNSTGVVPIVEAASGGTLAVNAGYIDVFPVGLVAGTGTSAVIGGPIPQSTDQLVCSLSYGSGTAPGQGNTIACDVIGYIF
jgi:hypothetical protein